MEFHRFTNLIFLAPNLASLICHSLDLCDAQWQHLYWEGMESSFANLTDLRLHHSAITAEALPVLLAACPRLRSLAGLSRLEHLTLDMTCIVEPQRESDDFALFSFPHLRIQTPIC